MLPRLSLIKHYTPKTHQQSRSGPRNSRRVVHRVVCITIALSLLANTAPAAPRTIVDVSTNVQSELAFWFYANQIGPRIWNFLTPQDGGKRQENQAERDARVARIKIFPGDVTVEEGQQVHFAALAYDSQDDSVNGVKFTWTANDDDRGRKVTIASPGHFVADVRGNFKVTAAGAGFTETVKVKVTPGRRPKKDEQPAEIRSISSRDMPPEAIAQLQKEGNKAAVRNASKRNASSQTKLAHSAAIRTANAAAPAAFFLDDGWGNSNYWSADDPGNTRGDPPGGPVDNGAGSGNFQFSAPITSLAGRGIDINLTLTYNSRVWNKANNNINYDIDRDWPAPGWSLGFGKMMGMGVNNGGMLIDPDGTRHSYAGTIQFFSWGTYFQGHTTDGSFIDYSYYSGTGGALTSGEARLPNGTIINYSVQGTGGLYPSSIVDPSGNFIYITYVNNMAPRIQTVTDTLGRSITFHYDSLNRLTAITGPALTSGTRTLVRLHYSQLALNYSFSGLTPIVRDSNPWIIDAIYYPGSNTGYWLSQSDSSYSTYGMLKKVSERRGMTFSGPAPVPPSQGTTDQGTITAGQMTRQEVYNYPLNTSDTTGTQASNLTDAPTYSSCVETWSRDGTNTDSATTLYSVNTLSTPRTTTITLPNGTVSKQYSHNSPGSYLDGLVYLDETKVGTTVLQSSSTQWEPGAYNSARPATVTATNQAGQSTSTQFLYGTVYNQVIDVRNFDFSGALLRSTRTQYENSANYTNRHIFSLPLVVDIYAGDNVTRVSRTVYQYDGQELTDTPGVIGHMESYNPYAPNYESCYCNEWDHWQIECLQWNCFWTNNYNPQTAFRGNLTQITTYANAAALTGAVTENRTYDITGNMITSSSSCCDKTTLSYTAATHYAYPVSQTRGSSTDPLHQVTTTSTYDFNTGLGLTVRDANDRLLQNDYDPTTLRPNFVLLPGGGHKEYTYDDAGLNVTETTYLQGHPTHTTIAEQKTSHFNGRGLVRQEKVLGQSGAWDIVDTVYDSMGQAIQESKPYRTGQTIYWNTSTYDALGRVTSSQSPDTSLAQTFYNEGTRPSVASTAPGETVRSVDPWGRERWARNDAQGRLVEVVEPDPNGSGSVATNGLLTTYAYDTLGNLTSVTQGSQTRSFKYDSLNRLKAQKLAEMNATLNDSGVYVGSGTWSDVFTYDDRSNLTSRTDARGVKTVYNYNGDPLNRLQSVSWDTSGFGDTNNPILPANTVTIQYRTKSSGADRKDITQVASVTTANVSTESYTYDTAGRTIVKTVTMNGRTSFPFVTNYAYDNLDRVVDVTYPAEHGNGTALRKLMHQDFDVANRLTGITMGGQSHASNIAYNATSQPTSIMLGVSGTNQVTENYTYNAQTSLLENQTVVRNGSTLLNLSYGYTGANGKRSGQLTSITNNLDQNKNRAYEYDTLGRLKRATSGQTNINWAQRYSYDRFGNRNNTYSYTAEQYVRNFYQQALLRQPNATELQNWLNTLRTAYTQGQSQFLTAMQNLGAAIFTSQEYLARQQSNTNYVHDLYHAYLFRDADSGGLANWVAAAQQHGWAYVRAGFDWSVEFALKVQGTSPYSSSGGTVPVDGWENLGFDATNNRVNVSGWYYDAAGNQTRVQRGTGWQRFQYDAANRLVRVKEDNNVTVQASYTYGADNQRLIGEVSGTRTYYAVEGGAVIAEYTEPVGSTTLTWARSYIYLGSRLISTLTPNGSGGANVSYHHPDRIGTRIVTNGQNTTYFEQVTLPYGTALNAESSDATNRRFGTYDRTLATGLDYALNRFYDPQQGRFTQVDPIAMGATNLENPQTLNLYNYCAGDPINRADPSGLGFLSFLKKVLRGIAKILTNKWVLLAVGIAVGIAAGFAFYWAAHSYMTGFFVKAGIVLAGTSAALITAAFHPIVQRAAFVIGGIISTIQGIAGILNTRVMGTPPWNPNSGIGPVSNFVQAAGGDDDPEIDPEDIVRIYTTAFRRQIKEALDAAYNAGVSAFNGTKRMVVNFSQCFTYQMGIDDAIDVVAHGLRGAGVAGLPIEEKPFVTPGASQHSSPFSKFTRRIFGNQRFNFGKKAPAPTLNRLPSSLFRLTPFIGRSAGRLIPFAGQALLIYDGVQIVRCTYRRW